MVDGLGVDQIRRNPWEPIVTLREREDTLLNVYELEMDPGPSMNTF